MLGIPPPAGIASPLIATDLGEAQRVAAVFQQSTADMLDVCPRDDYNGHMKIAGVAELKARLSSFLEQVRAGNEIVVTDRGVPIARLVPMEGKPEGGERRKRLIRAGLLRPGGRLLPGPPCERSSRQLPASESSRHAQA